MCSDGDDAKMQLFYTNFDSQISPSTNAASNDSFFAGFRVKMLFKFFFMDNCGNIWYLWIACVF